MAPSTFSLCLRATASIASNRLAPLLRYRRLGHTAQDRLLITALASRDVYEVPGDGGVPRPGEGSNGAKTFEIEGMIDVNSDLLVDYVNDSLDTEVLRDAKQSIRVLGPLRVVVVQNGTQHSSLASRETNIQRDEFHNESFSRRHMQNWASEPKVAEELQIGAELHRFQRGTCHGNRFGGCAGGDGYRKRICGRYI